MPTRPPAPTVVLLVLAVALLAACSSSPDGPSGQADTLRAEGEASVSGSPPRLPEGESAPKVRGQTLYVPCYSHIYFQDETRTLDLASTLTLRNTSLRDTITVTRVDYHDSDGELVRAYLSSSRDLPPLASTYFVVREDDLRGGVGASFIVTWRADAPVDPPFVEAVHITTKATLGVSFTSDAKVLTTER